MKRTALLIGLFSYTALFSQMPARKIDMDNVRQGENVEYCVTHKKMNELKQNPEFMKSWLKDQADQQAAMQYKSTEKGVVYKIPIVFHVLHNNGVENISDEQIYNALDILNRDFRLQNNDANNVQPDFVGMPSDVEVEFVLATKAPNGTCFKGITRTSSPLSYQGDNGDTQVTAIRNGNDVYQNSWPGDDYLNVFIVGDAGGAAGYTTNPASWSASQMGNGIWILHDYVGSIGTGGVGTSRALTHEVGHWLNLDHTWGPNNNPGNTSSCSTDDDVDDTPNCIGVTACLLNANTCSELVYELNYNQNLTSSNGNVRINVPHSLNQGDSIFISQIDGGIANPSLEGAHTITSIGNGYLVINLPWTNISNSTIDGTIVKIPYWSYDVRDNVENYMDYSYCSKMFTQGQVDRMRAALQVTSTGRKNLWQSANLTATGADGSTYLCKAEFTSNKTAVCLGDSISFSDDSYNAVTGWNWTFESGSPATSTEQNPVVVYNTPGVYAVTLSATDGSNADAETKTAYVHVYPSSYSLPFFEGFENYTSLSSLANWEVFNGNNNNTFVIDNSVSHSGVKCVKVANFGQSGSNIDELIAAPVDLSAVASNGAQVTLSFRYAYRKKTSADLEALKVFVTNNCGDSWVQRKTLSGNSLSTLTSSSSWSPLSAADWVTVHMINVTSEYWVDNFRYKFRFEGNGGNNFYLDDINLYLGPQSDELVLGIAEAGTIDELALYPNPSDQEVNLRFSVGTPQNTAIQIVDITGKVVQTNSVMAAAGSNLVMMDTSKLAAGTYMMTVKTASAQKVLQFVVK
jgi:PKD repeat protein